MDIKIDLDSAKVSKKLIKNMDKLQPILNQQVIKDSNYYAPKAEGTLQTSAITGTDMNDTKIVWASVYAHYLYVGDSFDFSRAVNPHARSRWFEAAKATKKSTWISMLNKEMEK